MNRYRQQPIGRNNLAINKFQLLNKMIGALVILVLPLGAIADNAATPHRLNVVASFSILADMTREIAGDAADVTPLVGANADAHVFEPSPADAKRLASADLIIVNGLHFEGWIDRLIEASAFHGPIVVATQGITPRLLNGAPDPHAWQSLPNAKLYVENIRQALLRVAPEKSASINARADAYQARIDRLEKNVRFQIDQTPVDRRRVITSHDAFGYFGAAYGIEFFSPQSWNTDSEASAADVARIIQKIRALHVRALFIENITDPRLVERIADEAGVVVGGTLYSDALSSAGTDADTYLKLIAHNTAALTNAMRSQSSQLSQFGDKAH